MNSITRPVMRYHGSKFRLADWVISHFPPHQIYVEPFGGAAAVLMKKPRSHGEVYNDLDSDIVNVMGVLRDPKQRKQLIEAVTLTPYSRDEFLQAYESTSCPVERARRTFIRAEMGFGSAGATKGKTGFRIDTKRKYGTAAQIWAKIPEKLAAFGLRLQGVLIENRPYQEVIENHDTDETLFYLDPPYLHSTREMGSVTYRHELTSQEHNELLDVALGLKGRVVLSGYPNPLYEERLKGWQCFTVASRIAAWRGTGLRVEALWVSPNSKATRQSKLFI